MKPMLHKDQLESLIDSYGLPVLLETLGQIAGEKAGHVAENWQDRALARAWDHCATKLYTLSAKLPRL